MIYRILLFFFVLQYTQASSDTSGSTPKPKKSNVVFPVADYQWANKTITCASGLSVCHIKANRSEVAQDSTFDCADSKVCIIRCSGHSACEGAKVIVQSTSTELELDCANTLACASLQLVARKAAAVSVMCHNRDDTQKHMNQGCKNMNIMLRGSQANKFALSCQSESSCKHVMIEAGDIPLSKVKVRCEHPTKSCAEMRVKIDRTAPKSKLDVSCMEPMDYQVANREELIHLQSCYNLKLVCNEDDTHASAALWNQKTKLWDYFCSTIPKDSCCPLMGETLRRPKARTKAPTTKPTRKIQTEEKNQEKNVNQASNGYDFSGVATTVGAIIFLIVSVLFCVILTVIYILRKKSRLNEDYNY